MCLNLFDCSKYTWEGVWVSKESVRVMRSGGETQECSCNAWTMESLCLIRSPGSAVLWWSL